MTSIIPLPPSQLTPTTKTIIKIQEHYPVKWNANTLLYRTVLKGVIFPHPEYLYIRTKRIKSRAEQFELADMEFVCELEAHIELITKSGTQSGDATIAIYTKMNDYVIKPLHRPTKYHILARAGFSVMQQ